MKLEATFARRQTPLPSLPPVALTVAFCDDETKRQQWEGFLNKGVLEGAKPSFVDVVSTISEFVMPVAAARSRSQVFDMTWSTGGPWIKHES